MTDLFSSKKNTKKTNISTYNANNIIVLEGLEPVRTRPGMYIGGVDEIAYHHMFDEPFDNSMDEVGAGYATRITVELHLGGKITVSDNGRGIPIDPHPKFPDKSALEVILTTLHSGGKFNSDSYQTAGGLHGVGISVVNALSEFLEVTVIRDKKIYQQQYSRGLAVTALAEVGKSKDKSGTKICFRPDPEIFGDNLSFKPKKLYNLVKSKAYLIKDVEINWICAGELIKNSEVPELELIKFPNGIVDYLKSNIKEDQLIVKDFFQSEVSLPDGGKIEWIIGWHNEDGFSNSYCNTIHTPLGGTHEQGFRLAIVKALKNYGEMTANKKATNITADDLFAGACFVLSIFIGNPQFQGQTKEKLVNIHVSKIVENIVKDRFDHWLTLNKANSDNLLNYAIARVDERQNRKLQKDISRKQITQKIRLPGKLTDCSINGRQGTEIFLPEGDSAAGSSRQARDRKTQAIMPLRGKILNVANSSFDKIRANSEIADIELALGCGTLKNYNEDNLRYDKVIIMTDADVDGAHITTLLLTYFFKFMPKLIKDGHLYLAKPPLYRIIFANKTYYVQNDKEKDKLLATLAKKRGQIEISRFKGLGEMTASQLKETTMDPAKRSLIQVNLPDNLAEVETYINNLMGKKAEYRFQFIQSHVLTRDEHFLESLDL